MDSTGRGQILQQRVRKLRDRENKYEIEKELDVRDPGTPMLEWREEGRAYKDVVNPFVAAAWLREHDLAVLKIRRDLVDVAFSMGARDWWYPCSAAESGASGELALLEGLHRAQQCIDRVPGETIDYDDVVHDEGVLHAALRRLYPGDRLGRAHFIDGGFAATRDAIVARRESPDFRRLSRLAQSIPGRN